MTQLGAILGPSSKAILYGEQPKGLLRGTSLHLQRAKRLLDNVLDLLSALAMGELHRAKREGTLGLEEPHYCHGHLCFPRYCLAQERCFGVSEVWREDGVWSAETLLL